MFKYSCHTDNYEMPTGKNFDDMKKCVIKVDRHQKVKTLYVSWFFIDILLLIFILQKSQRVTNYQKDRVSQDNYATSEYF